MHVFRCRRLLTVSLTSCAIVWITQAIVADEVTANGPSERGVRSALPPGELGKVVELGRELVHATKDHPLSAPYVGNALNCTSCHLDDGTHPKAGSFLGTAGAYPAWSPREQRVITLEDRVLNCFMRSENGIRPPNGSRVAVAISAYITWLSSGYPMAMNPDKPLGPRSTEPIKIDPSSADVERGKQLYNESCAYCHNEDGSGSEDGPPVWGEQSYNDGAGLSRNPKLAAWLHVAMPLDDPYLTEQQALDIAAYLNTHERPKFDLKEHLPPPERRGEYNGRVDE